MPVWFHKFEVPYGFLAETFCYIFYRSLELSGGFDNDGDSSWNITTSEWDQNCVFEFVYEARRGKLWYLLGAAVDAAREMGMEAVPPDADRQDASELLDFVDQFRWSQVPPANRIRSEVQDMGTLVHAGEN